MIWRMAFGAVVVACLSWAAAALALSPSLVDRAERATALVDVNTGEGRAFGSAFCISDTGLFATDGHVVLGSTGEIKVVIRPGEKDQRVALAHVLGIDYQADLAVIQTDNPGPVPKLNLGNSDALLPTQEITAFGYPFGNMLALDKDTYPSITVNSGKVTALRREKGDLALIQVDALVNPGNSGGPVMDSEGRVIGLVESGVPGAGLNFVTPAARLKKMLNGPMVVIDPVIVDYAQRTRQRNFSITVKSLSHAVGECDLDFKITDPKGEVQTASGKTSGGKCDLLLALTSDNSAIKWNPFEDRPPEFKFVLTLTQFQKVIGTEEGTILLTGLPMGGEIVKGSGPRKGGGSGGISRAGNGGSHSNPWPKENPLDPLPADAEETPRVGTEKANEFREMSAGEDLAIGVEYTTGETGGKPVMTNIRLLYSKPAGERGQSIMAREGYVVGGLFVEADQYPTGQCFSGFKVIFIRRKDKNLDASDTYTSEWIGRPSTGKQKQLAGTGERVIGISGRKGVYMRAIGLVIRKPADTSTTQSAIKGDAR